MIANDVWIDKIARDISKLEMNLLPSQRKRYRLPLLLDVARRVTVFSAECEACQILKARIEFLISLLVLGCRIEDLNPKDYLNSVKDIVRHLQTTHSLVRRWHFLKKYVILGLTIGILLVILGLVLGSFGITLLGLNITLPAMVTRLVLSSGFGYFRDRIARHRGKVL